MKHLAVVLVALVALAAPRIAEAQASGRGNASQAKDKDIPVSARPPAGMCRLWLDDVPVAQQPAPTDCPTAVRNRTPKSRVIFGDDYVQPRRDTTKRAPDPKTPAIKGFAPSKDRKPPLRFP